MEYGGATSLLNIFQNQMSISNKGTYKYDVIKRCQPLVWGNMTHDDASVETGVGGQAKYDVMMVFCGNALQQHHETLKTSSSWYSDCHTAHFFIY